MKKRLSALLYILVPVLVLLFLFLILGAPKRVFISFDAELVDRPDTFSVILPVLERNNVTATFFVTGAFADKNTDLINYLDSKGNEIACHTYGHELMTQLNDEDKMVTIKKCVDAISRIIGHDPQGFRAPDHDIDEKTFSLLRDFGFSYDASLISGLSMFFPKPMIAEVPLSSFLLMPLEDYIYIYVLKKPDLFFILAHMYRGKDVSLLMHPRFVSAYTEDIESLIKYYKKGNARFMNYRDFKSE